ncbi:hypothetical protein [Gorillibacterium massiliense]|uniref:hypothetical protein n=1 Tax=Gorillibacterium massiliense TaxID=1280390 RepID=UPI0004BA03E7
METETAGKRKLKAPRIISWSLLALVVIIVLFNSFAVVQYGHVGVRKTLGKLDDQALSEGIHFKIPFIQSIHSG